MKRRDLVKQLEDLGAVLIRHGGKHVRHGGKHDWYQNPETKISQPVPRHSEVSEMLAKSIIKNWVADRRFAYPA